MQYAVLCSTRTLQYVLFMLCFVWDPIVFSSRMLYLKEIQCDIVIVN